MGPPMASVKVVHSRRVHEGKVFDLRVDEIEYPSGRHAIREVAEHSGGAVAIPLLDDGTIVLVRQERYPLGQSLLELPAGKLQKGEDPAVCAGRELQEETGYEARELLPVGSIFTSPGFCTEQLHLFLARGLRESPSGQQLEEGEESLRVERVPFEEALAMVKAGTIVDAKTICGILLAREHLQRS